MPVFLYSFVIYMILFKIGGFPLKKKHKLRDGEIFDPRMILHLQIAGGLFKKLQQKMGIRSLPFSSSLFLNRVVASKVMRRFSLHCGESRQFSDDVLLQVFRFHEMFGDRLDSSYANMARMFLRGRIESPTMRPFRVNLLFAQRLAEIGHEYYGCSKCKYVLARILIQMPTSSYHQKAIDIASAGRREQDYSIEAVIAMYECLDRCIDQSTFNHLDPKIRAKIDDMVCGNTDQGFNDLDYLDLLLIQAKSLYLGSSGVRFDFINSKKIAESLLYEHGHPGACVFVARMLLNSSSSVCMHHFLKNDQKRVLLDEVMSLIRSVTSIGYYSNDLGVLRIDVNEEFEQNGFTCKRA